MFVQDISSPGRNIAVDVSNKDARQFKEMCRAFESANAIESAIDAYLLKVFKTRPPCLVDLTMDTDADEPPPAKRAALDIRPVGSAVARRIGSGATQLLTNVIMSNKKSIFQDIPTTAIELVTRTVRRISDERDIMACLKRNLNTANLMSLQAIPLGSSTYGFGSTGTDFNILLNTST